VFSRLPRFSELALASMNAIGKQLTQRNGARRGRRGI